MNRRLIAALLMFGALLGIAALALADEPGDNQKGKGKRMPGYSLRWKATSPAIYEGYQYDFLVTNKGDEAQEARVVTEIMDHRNHTNTNVINEELELEPGEERELTALNDYGPANHFNTMIGSNTKDFDVEVKVADADGNDTAWFNEKAFLIEEGKAKGAKGKDKAKGKEHTHDEGTEASGGHDHDRGLAAALGDTARLMPFSLGVLATAGFGLYAVRRRWTQAASGLAGSVASPRVWKAVAAAGLGPSAALHIGLAPTHFEEAAVQGVFFAVMGVLSAIVAAAILTWPSRLVYLAGAAISLALIALWVIFLLVPPPGSATAEAIDPVGLLTKATELVAATACAVLWLKDRRIRRPYRNLG